MHGRNEWLEKVIRAAEVVFDTSQPSMSLLGYAESLLGYAENSSSSPGFGYIPIGTALAVGPEIRTHSSIEQRDQLDQEEDMRSTPHGPFIDLRECLDGVTLAGAATLAPQVVQAQVAGSVPLVRLAQTGASPTSRT